LTLNSTPCNTTVLVEGSEEHSHAKDVFSYHAIFYSNEPRR